jgi:hypothetical protein
MPAQRLNDDPVSVGRYDVAGVDADAARLPHFVKHVGLFGDGRKELRRDERSPLVHMGPPLGVNEGEIPVHAVGTAGLSTDDILQVQVFVDDRAGEYEAAKIRENRRAQYCIIPHAEPHEEPDGTVTYWRFSCAGFVIEAYRYVDLDLLVTDQERLPPVNLHLVEAAYPGVFDSDRLRELYNLRGDGPWKIVLAGYVFNALNRSIDAIRGVPYQPVLGDGFFPRNEGSIGEGTSAIP